MKFKTLGALPCLALIAACQTTSDTSATTDRLGSATLRLGDGTPAGTVQLLGSGDTVTFNASLMGLPEGVHAIHLHTTGSCVPPDFKSAGGHLNPGGHQHGTDNPAGAHLGDLPNFTAGASGTGTVSATLRGTQADVLASIFDEDGAAVVVHAGPDDYKSDPAGNAGGRIACGVLSPG